MFLEFRKVVSVKFADFFSNLDSCKTMVLVLWKCFRQSRVDELPAKEQCSHSEKKDSERVGNQKNRLITIFGWVALITAYGFLIPGLLLPLYMYRLQGITINKTMWSTIEMVREDGGLFPAVLLAFFGIAVPVIKLLLVSIAHMRDLPFVSRLVVWVSKWAIVDALVACFIMAYFANAVNGAIVSHIETGFIFFVLYCVLSTTAALILDDRDVDFRSIYTSKRFFGNQKWLERKSTSAYSLAVAAGLSCASMILYTVRMGMSPEEISMSILSACNRLIIEKNADPRPMIIIFLFVVMIPIAEFVFMVIMIHRPIDNFYTRCALRSLPQCGLLDVFAVSVVVMDIFLNTLKVITVSIPPLGFTLLCLSVGATCFARFVLGRYLAKLFGGALVESTTSLELSTDGGSGRATTVVAV